MIEQQGTAEGCDVCGERRKDDAITCADGERTHGPCIWCGEPVPEDDKHEVDYYYNGNVAVEWVHPRCIGAALETASPSPGREDRDWSFAATDAHLKAVYMASR